MRNTEKTTKGSPRGIEYRNKPLTDKEKAERPKITYVTTFSLRRTVRHTQFLDVIELLLVILPFLKNPQKKKVALKKNCEESTVSTFAKEKQS